MKKAAQLHHHSHSALFSFHFIITKNMKALNQFFSILIRRFAHFLNSIAHIYKYI